MIIYIVSIVRSGPNFNTLVLHFTNTVQGPYLSDDSGPLLAHKDESNMADNMSP